jgi:hypothetical protein
MFQVGWVQSALDQLATTWIEADSALRASITSAMGQIDHCLRVDPEAQGESRERNRRTMFIAPLGIDYLLETDDRTVIVLRVWLARRR